MSRFVLVVPLVLTACGEDGGTSTGTAAETSTATSDATATTTSSTGNSGPTTSNGTQPGTDSATSGPTSGPTTTTGVTTEALTTTTTGVDPGTMSGTTITTETTTTTGNSTTTTGSTGSTGTTTGDPGTTDSTGSTGTTGDDTTTGGNGLWDSPNLWYSVHESLIYIEIDPMDGSVVTLVHNQLVPDVPLVQGQNGLTMLEDGSLLGSRESAQGTQIYHVPDPPTTVNTPAAATFLGVVPTDMIAPLRIEALYTDCDGRVYLMDTGVDVSNATGNRLLRFTGDYLQGQLEFEVITDLQNASVGDIDDMSPGIVNGEVNDKLGFAMDSTVLWQIDYTTGTGMQLAQTDGTWGIHALGGPLFDDATPRLYILSAGNADTGAELFQVNLNDFSSSPPLIEGPDLNLQIGQNGWSGLAGPLTECMSLIPQ